MKMGVWGCLHPQGKKLITSLMVVIVVSVFPFNYAFAGEYDDDFATVSTWLGDINGKLALVYSESTNILMQLNQRTISNTYTLRYYIEETYNDQHNMWLQLTTDSQNSTTTIRGYVSNISSKISSVKTSIDNIATDIGTTVTKLTSISTATSNIYSKLGAMQTSDINYYTMMNNWELSWVAYKNQWLDWGTSWNTSIGTINTNIAAINNNLITGFTSIEGSLDDLYSKTNDIYAILNQVKGVINNSNYIRVGQTPNGAFYDAVIDLRDKLRLVNTNISSMKTTLEAITIPNYSTVLNSISGYVDGIESKLDTLHTDLQNIYHYIELIRGYNSDRNLYYWRVGQVDFGNFYDSINGVKGKLDNIVTAVNSLQSLTVNVDTSGIEAQLSTIIGLLSVPSNTNTIVGDLDSLQFEDDVDDLVNELSNLAPFGAVFLLSSEIGMIVTANTIQTPQFVMPFNFFGNNNVVIDLSWLITAKPFLNFLMMFLLVYSLAVVSMKYARNEATS